MIQAAPQILVKDKWIPDALRFRIRGWSPQSHLGKIIKECFRYLPAEQVAALLDAITSVVVIESSLALTVICAGGRREPLGVVSRRVVTNNGVAYIVDGFQNLVELENMKYHGLGTGTNAESQADSALQSELTTQYNPNNTRATGTTEEGSSANIYKTVATNTLDEAAAVTEHGIFSQAATGGGVLLDRSVFSVVNLAAGDGLQSTYQWTANAGG
mgnify:CR=1 FL=1